MAAALAAIFELARQRGIEKHHRFRAQGAGLGGAKGQHVHAAFPGGLRGRTAKMRHGIGEAGAVHMQLEAMGMGQGGDRRDFAGRIDRAQFAGLAQADGTGLDAMNAAIQPRQRLGDRLRGEFAVRPRQPDQLGAGKEFRGAAFRGHDVAVLVAQDRAKRRRQTGQRKRIGGRAGEDRKDGNIAFEQPGKAGRQALGDGIMAIGQGGPAIGLFERRPDLRQGAIGIVGSEIHAPYQLPVLAIEAQGSFGGSAAPSCSNSMEIPSGERIKAIWPSRGGRFMTTPSAISFSQSA